MGYDFIDDEDIIDEKKIIENELVVNTSKESEQVGEFDDDFYDDEELENVDDSNIEIEQVEEISVQKSNENESIVSQNTQSNIDRILSEINSLKAKREELEQKIEIKKQEINNCGVEEIESKKSQLKELVDMEKFNEISIVLQQIKQIEEEKEKSKQLDMELEQLRKELEENNILIEEKKNELKQGIDNM